MNQPPDWPARACHNNQRQPDTFHQQASDALTGLHPAERAAFAAGIRATLDLIDTAANEPRLDKTTLRAIRTGIEAMHDAAKENPA